MSERLPSTAATSPSRYLPSPVIAEPSRPMTLKWNTGALWAGPFFQFFFSIFSTRAHSWSARWVEASRSTATTAPKLRMSESVVTVARVPLPPASIVAL